MLYFIGTFNPYKYLMIILRVRMIVHLKNIQGSQCLKFMNLHTNT